MNTHVIYDHRIKMYYNDQTKLWGFDSKAAAHFTARIDAHAAASAVLARCATLQLDIIEMDENFQPVNPEAVRRHQALHDRGMDLCRDIRPF